MSHPAIRVESLSKHYRVGARQQGYKTLRESLAEACTAPLRRLRAGVQGPKSKVQGGEDGARMQGEDFWALKDVSFEVQPGEVVGIIGRNGAGKSTLLKILSRITEPTSGKIELRGRVGSLLEVGTGFHPELTGRENIYMNGSILGMSQREIQRKFDEIVEFSGIEDFLDTPVKRYSSGMYVRLAFSVAAHLEPEILLVDEVLAVGDAEFQKKCLGKMDEVAHHGRTVFFVSHNMPAVRSLTQKCIYLSNGQLVTYGPTGDVISDYLDAALRMRVSGEQSVNYYRRETNKHTPVRFKSVWLDDESDIGDSLPVRSLGDDLTINVELESARDFETACLSLVLQRNHEQRALTLFSHDADFPIRLHRGRQVIACKIKQAPLSPGRYTVCVGINETANTMAWDVLIDFPLFDICMPALDSGELSWPTRPWGAIHWRHVEWQESTSRSAPSPFFFMQ